MRLSAQLILSLFFLGACSPMETVPSQLTHQSLIDDPKWDQVEHLKASDFDLFALIAKVNHSTDDKNVEGLTDEAKLPLLSIYIEGDGTAWQDRYKPSLDPTPSHAVGLALATLHPHSAVAYLARPCQFVGGLNARSCSFSDWTHGRFSNKVIANMNQAISELKQRLNAKQLLLVGYSGGASVAALIASQREDVSGLVTVAGNLDHERWTRHHGISPLSESLNASEVTVKLKSLPQWHFIGGRDETVPPKITRDYVSSFPNSESIVLIEVSGYTHDCCWSHNWRDMIQSILAQLH